MVISDSEYPYIEEARLDYWERSFRYLSDGRTCKIISYGEDNKLGGEGYDEDIVLNCP